MNSTPGVETDLGWALGVLTRSYLSSVREATAAVPGGVRGYLVLAAAGQGEPRSQLALAQHLGVDRTAMTYLLDDLERAGLVERRPDPADRRARRVAVTGAGRTLLEELRTALFRVEEHLLAPLQGAEAAVLRDLLQRVATHLAPANPCEVGPCGPDLLDPGPSDRAPALVERVPPVAVRRRSAARPHLR